MTHRKGEFYSQKARREHYRARSVYKLQEIQQRYKIFKRGDRVLDLGCAPGSWSQFAIKSVGPKGSVVGIDTTIVSPLPQKNFQYIEADVTNWDPAQLDPPLAPFDVLLSDMAPATTGIKITDRENSYQLSLRALELARIALKPGGKFVCKIFQGEDWGNFVKEVKKNFNKTSIFKPKATRKASVETYIIGFEMK
jgi:23S rRNA (uridine2552-2'-O)-methyltransferase